MNLARARAGQLGRLASETSAKLRESEGGQELRAAAARAADAAREAVDAARIAERVEDGIAAARRAGRELLAPETAEQLGERLRAEVERTCVIDEGWARDQAERVTARLNAVRAPRPPLTPVVVWAKQPNAVAAPGRYIYITRALQDVLADDDAVAFVLAHEMAHHDLGHVTLDTGLGEKLAKLPASVPIAVVAELVSSVWLRPDMEFAADERGLSYCLDAGFDREGCLRAFDVLEAHALNYYATESVFGTTPDPDAWEGWAEWQEWWRQKRAGYAPIIDRKARLREA
jgi:hypothetical protein